MPKKMVRRLNSNAHVMELHGCVDRICRTWTEYPHLAEKPIISPVLISLNKENNTLLVTMNREKVASNLKDFDEKRDTAVRNLGVAIDGMAVLPGVDADKIGVLKKAYAKFGKKITNLNRSEESSKIASMLHEFSTDEAVAALEEFPQLKTLLETLKESEEAFQKELSALDVAKKNKGTSATSQKDIVLKILNDKLVSFVTLVYDDAEYHEFALRVESEIARVNAIVADRAKKGVKDDTNKQSV